MARVTTTKRSILDAAVELAATKGITGTTMDEVADRAGVAKGSLYYNFSSKDQLFEALLQEGVAALAARLRAAREEKSGWLAVEALAESLLGAMADNTALAKLMAAEIFRTERPWNETIFSIRHEAFAIFAEAIVEADPSTAENGRSGLIASSVFGAVLMAGLEWLVFEPERDRAEVAETILQAIGGRLAR